jgi:hypothetical protein
MNNGWLLSFVIIGVSLYIGENNLKKLKRHVRI